MAFTLLACAQLLRSPMPAASPPAVWQMPTPQELPGHSRVVQPPAPEILGALPLFFLIG